jgi:hypothetical protein
MFAIVVVVAVVVFQGIASFRGGDGEPALRDPDADAVLPEIDRGPLAGFARPAAKTVVADPTAFRGRFVRVVGRLRGEPEAVTLPGERSLVVHRFDIVDADRHLWRVFSAEPPADLVVKVLGMFLRADLTEPTIEPISSRIRPPEGPPLEVVAIRTIASVPEERFPRFDPLWLKLVRDGTDEDRENLQTQPVWYALAWARSSGPEGIAMDLAAGVLRAERMPTAPEIAEDLRRREEEGGRKGLQGRLFRLRGRISDLHEDHGLPENPAGLESVYRLVVVHDRGERQQWEAAVLAPREALPADLGRVRLGEEVVAEGIYLKVWSRAEARGRLVHRPLLIAPRVRMAADAEEER